MRSVHWQNTAILGKIFGKMADEGCIEGLCFECIYIYILVNLGKKGSKTRTEFIHISIEYSCIKIALQKE